MGINLWFWMLTALSIPLVITYVVLVSGVKRLKEHNDRKYTIVAINKKGDPESLHFYNPTTKEWVEECSPLTLVSDKEALLVANECADIKNKRIFVVDLIRNYHFKDTIVNLTIKDSIKELIKQMDKLEAKRVSNDPWG